MSDEIKSEETNIIKCQYCGKPQEEGKDIKRHERFCSKNPNNVRSKKSQSSGEGTIPEKSPTPTSPDDTHKRLIISEVQPSTIDPEFDDVAWFMDEMGIRKWKVPMFIGMLENIPHVLVTTIDGALIPASLLPGFIGMHSKYHDFSDQDKPADEQPEEPTEALNEPIKRDLEHEISEQVITPPTIHASEPKKESIFARILGKKEKKEENPMLESNTAMMLRKIAANSE